ncbi:MAG: PAS domain S-box protein [Desulfomonilaceae bacterium]
MSLAEKNKEQLIVDLTQMDLQLRSMQIDLDASKKRESQFREIIDRATEGIFIAQDGFVKYENSACCDITGYSFGSWSSTNVISGLVHPDDRNMVRQYHSRRLEGKESPGRYDFRIVCKDGSIKWIEMKASVCVWEERTAVLCLMTDITERKKSERAAIERERHFISLLETIPDALIVYDANAIVTFVNSAFEQLYGWSAEELVHKSLNNFVPPEEQEITRQSWERTIKGEKVTFETKRWTKDRRMLDLLISTAILRDADGNHTTSIVIHRDITEFKRALKALKENEELFRAIVDGDPDAIFVQTNGLFSYLNGPAVKLFGADAAEDLIGRPILERFHPSLHGSIIERMRVSNIEKRQVPNAEEIIVRMDGTEVDVEVSAVPINFRGIDGSLVFAHDITSRKQANRERLLLTTAIEQSDEAVMITDTEAVILYVNPAFERVTGFSAAEAIGKKPRILIESNEADADIYDALRMTLERGDVWRGRLTNQKKDKTLYEAEVTISPIKDTHGKVVNYVGVSRDVTKEALLEKQFIQAQKMEAVGTLAGGIAHDFNNLLQAILGYSELILRRKSEGDRDISDIQRILQAGKRGAELVKSLLMFSRKVEPTYRPVNLNHEIIQVQSLLSRTIPKTIKIDLHLTGDLSVIQADQSQMGQVLMNLCINARDAMPNGGTLTIETENVELGQDYCRTHLQTKPGNYVSLTVADNGEGIDKETLAHIFEPFFTTKGVGQGTGLGLATVYGIVRQHGGHIECFSEPGIGTTFRIYFPSIQREEDSRILVDEQSIPGGSETILLVDDDDIVRNLVATALGNYGYRVIEAQNGKEAVEIYRREGKTVSLVILDLIMPEMDGRQCFDEIIGLDSEAKVIVATGHPTDRSRDALFLSKAKSFIDKPYNIKSLLGKVRQVIDTD